MNIFSILINYRLPIQANKKAQLSIRKTRYSLYSSCSRSSKANDFHVIWKPICDFLLVINSNIGPLSPFPRYDQFSVKKKHFSTSLTRPSRATAGPKETFSRSHQTFSRGLAGENFFEFFFSKWYILAYVIFMADDRAPKRRGARGS